MLNPTPSTAVSIPDVRDAVFRQWDVRGERALYIADALFPRLDVEFESANFKMIPREEYLKSADTTVAEGYNQAAMKYSQGSYSSEERGLKMKVSRKNAAIIGWAFNAQMAATGIVLSKLFRDHEIRVAALAEGADYGGSTAEVTKAWGDAADADPIKDVDIGKEKVKKSCGMVPNLLQMGWSAWNKLKECDQIIDRIKYSGHDDPKNVAPQAVAAILHVDRIVIAGGLKDTALQGKPSVLDFIWNPDKALLAYVVPNPTLDDLTFGFNAHWAGDGSDYNFTVEEYYDVDVRADVVRARRHVGPQIRSVECGYQLTKVLTKA